ncbi:hypothetical protein [Thermomicrobium sp.]
MDDTDEVTERYDARSSKRGAGSTTAAARFARSILAVVTGGRRDAAKERRRDHQLTEDAGGTLAVTQIERPPCAVLSRATVE